MNSEETWAYLLNDDSEKEKAKGIKKCVIKEDLCLKILRIAYQIIKSY